MPIDEAKALRVQLDFVIDRETGSFRWVTHGMTSIHDIAEQDLIFRALQSVVEISFRATAAESKEVH